MRWLIVCPFVLSLAACDAPEQAEVHSTNIDSVLNLPQVNAGMTVDTNFSSIRIYSEKVDGVHTIPGNIELSDDSLTDIVNIYADSTLNSAFVDSIIEVYCVGKDIRLIGINNGQELAIPFHCLHRFPSTTDTIGRYQSDFHEVFVEESSLQVNERLMVYENAEDYFKAFYGDAFNPIDSNPRFPNRERNRVILITLMAEGASWDETGVSKNADSAKSLAAYNEFVNKLEIFDKVESFCTMKEAVMECLPVSVTWGRLMQVFGEHYATVSSLRESAKKYLADQIANDGRDPSIQFTDEDLRLLFPDRLRWNGRISGVHEHRYDPDLLAEFVWLPVAPMSNR